APSVRRREREQGAVHAARDDGQYREELRAQRGAGYLHDPGASRVTRRVVSALILCVGSVGCSSVDTPNGAGVTGAAGAASSTSGSPMTSGTTSSTGSGAGGAAVTSSTSTTSGTGGAGTGGAIGTGGATTGTGGMPGGGGGPPAMP